MSFPTTELLDVKLKNDSFATEEYYIKIGKIDSIFYFYPKLSLYQFLPLYQIKNPNKIFGKIVKRLELMRQKWQDAEKSEQPKIEENNIPNPST